MKKTILAEEFAAGINLHVNVLQIKGGSFASIIENDEVTMENVAYIVSEYCPHGDAWDLLLAMEEGFSDEMTRGIFLQILNGVECMHKHGIVHRDVKLDNVFIGNDGLLKVSDFGFSKFYK